ncbi:hypothetical protein K456DRAFT_190297 [Colletotrichum gloeosporioides 23]|nr:hypothetical protein K456DRAFT_190297 [Colletotrichum gloeosporioides 23]
MFPERSRFAIPDIQDNVTGNRFLVSYRREPPPPEYRHLRPGRANSHLVSFGSALSQESRRVPGEIPPVWSRLVGSLITYCFVVGELWGLWSQSKAKKTTSATAASNTIVPSGSARRPGEQGSTGLRRPAPGLDHLRSWFLPTTSAPGAKPTAVRPTPTLFVPVPPPSRWTPAAARPEVFHSAICPLDAIVNNGRLSWSSRRASTCLSTC